METRFDQKLTRHLDTVTRQRGDLGAPQVLVSTPSGDYSYGDRSLPFHSASIGKTATATIVMQLVAELALTLDTAIHELLAEGTLDGLFVHKGVDHAESVTVGQLLDHTSGAADYFEGRVTRGQSFIDLVTSEPDREWSPSDLLAFSRENQSAVAAPGTRFAYSDTGYILLGLAIEAVTGRAFHDVLHERILGPLGMDDSYLMFRSTPVNGLRPIAPLYLGRVEASTFASVSCDWAGGGIVTTVDDLARFSRALHGGAQRGERGGQTGGALVAAAQWAEMRRIRGRFRPGIHYGSGLMELRFEGFFPLLRGLPRPTGHIGVLGTHMFYDSVNDAHIVMNFGSTREMVRSFKTLIQIEQLLGRYTAS